MFISRRQFLKYCSIAAGAIGLTTTDLMKLEKVLASTGGVPVIWISGQNCTGCTTSLANSVYYQTIQELLLLNQAASTVDLRYHQTLMAGMATQATQQTFPSTYALVVEGSIPTAIEGQYCQTGHFTGVSGETVKDMIDVYAPNAAAVITVGTCAAYGGIPAAAGNVTQAKGFLAYMASTLGGTQTSAYRAMRAKTVNVPGCPPNPNWMVGTIAYIISNFVASATIKLPTLDALRRPRIYYGERICNYCDRFTTSLGANPFVGVNPTLVYNRLSVNEPDQIGSPSQNVPGGRCLKLAGCKGSRTKSDCAVRKWHSPAYANTGINWCVGAGAPCQGCTQNFFPDRMSPFHYIR